MLVLKSRVVTVDETSTHFYDPETKQHSMELRHSGASRPNKFRVQESVRKVLASVFQDCQGIVMIYFLDKDTGSTITGNYYLTILTSPRKSTVERRR